jgi:hypothetical protein
MLGTNQPPAGQPTEPEPKDWSKVNEVCCVQVIQDGNDAWRCYECDGTEKGPFKELFWPVYVPTPASESAGDQGENKKDDKDSGGSPAVSTADKYWAECASQARSSAKWIATSLGAALAAIIGTAPLTPLNGKDVDWLSWPGLGIVGGLVLLGVTFLHGHIGAGARDDLLHESESKQESKQRRQAQQGAGVARPSGRFLGTAGPRPQGRVVA